MLNLTTEQANTNVNLNSNIEPCIAHINFDRLKWKLCHSPEATWDENLADMAEVEYKKFLNLKYIYPKMSLVPSKLVDKFWHEHILDTESYAKDCEKVFGKFIHHFPYFGIYGEKDNKNLQESFNNTIHLYEKHFGEFPKHILTSQAARCEDHACHVPSECACRTSGACN